MQCKSLGAESNSHSALHKSQLLIGVTNTVVLNDIDSISCTTILSIQALTASQIFQHIDASTLVDQLKDLRSASIAGIGLEFAPLFIELLATCRHW